MIIIMVIMLMAGWTREQMYIKDVYCNHCEPCPAGIDIGAVNKFYDLALIGDDMAKEHYLTLEKNASDCVGCGHCNNRCPFSVDQMKRMQDIRGFFKIGNQDISREVF